MTASVQKQVSFAGPVSGVDPVAHFKTSLVALREEMVKAKAETEAVAKERDEVRLPTALSLIKRLHMLLVINVHFLYFMGWQLLLLLTCRLSRGQRSCSISATISRNSCELKTQHTDIQLTDS